MYKANQVGIQIKASQAWILFAEGEKYNALDLIIRRLKWKTQLKKVLLLPGEVIPARELLGDMLLQMNNNVEALQAYQTDLKRHPNRFNGLYGAGFAAEMSGDTKKAKFYYHQLLAMTVNKSTRIELVKARFFLKGLQN